MPRADPPSHAPIPPTPCAQEGCPATVPAGKFSHIRALEAGWFFQKNKTAWCPGHTPAWVAEWRARTPVEERRKW